MGTIFCSCVSLKRSVRWTELSRKGFCCWGNTLWPAKKNVKIHMRSNCHSPLLIPSPDSSHLKSRNYMPAKKGGRNWKHGKRSILIKVRSEVNFKIIRKGMPCFGASLCLVHTRSRVSMGGYVAFCDIPVRIEGAVSLRSKEVRNLSTPLAPFFGRGKLYRRMGWYIATPSSKMSLLLKHTKHPRPKMGGKGQN